MPADKPAAEPTIDRSRPVALSLDDQKGLLLKCERLVTENKQLREELDAYKALDEERAAREKATRESKDKSRPMKPVAITHMIGVGRRNIKPGDDLLPEEVQGKEGYNYRLVPAE